MALKKGIENRVRGWIPKEPNMPSRPATISPENKPNHRNRLPKGEVRRMLVWTVMVFGFVFASIGYLHGGNALGALFLWFACVVGVSLVLDASVQFGKEFNPKLVMGILLMVINLGGALAGLYVFSLPSNFFARAFSVVMMAVAQVPMLIAVIAYVWGKKELSKKLLDWYSGRR
ncbi:MAG: ABC transporter permease [Candidatus Bathyarchaeota archaeon]|nr:ABC transporter permease [Candidatus Bathyarchaeota archaeon]